jgi:hypothetical protein
VESPEIKVVGSIPRTAEPLLAMVEDSHPLITPKALGVAAFVGVGLAAIAFVVGGGPLGLVGTATALVCCALIAWLYWSEAAGAVRARAWRRDLLLPASSILVILVFNLLALTAHPVGSPSKVASREESAPSKYRRVVVAEPPTTAEEAPLPPPRISKLPNERVMLAKPRQPPMQPSPPVPAAAPAKPPPAREPSFQLTDDLLANARPFPEPSVPPTTPFSAFTNGAVRDRVSNTCGRLRRLELAYNNDAKSIAARGVNVATDQFQAVQKRLDDRRTSETMEFRKVLPEVRALHFELLNRLKIGPPNRYNSTFSVQAAEALGSGFLVGESPTQDLCAYLDNLASRLKD